LGAGRLFGGVVGRADAEVGGIRVVEDERRDAGLGFHHEAFREFDADLLRANQREERGLGIEVGAGGIPERVPLAPVAGLEQLFARRAFGVREPPRSPYLRVYPLGRRFGRLERERLQRVRAQVLAGDLRALREVADLGISVQSHTRTHPFLSELGSAALREELLRSKERLDRELRQETIHTLMIRAARRGRRVVRLKAGDPFVLGRGGEEALALRAAGVQFEIVPGVSSALAAPALAGIPLTHRGLSTGFIVVSGHDESSYRPLLEMLPPQSVTLVVLMGLAHAGDIAAVLLATGWRGTTPAAVSFAAGTPEAAVWTGTLATLGSSRENAPAGAPGTIVIGPVASLATAIGAAGAARKQESHVSHG